MYKTLYHQLSPLSRNILATLLGFGSDEWRGSRSGFVCNLRDMPPVPSGWTYDDLLKAYCDYLTNK